MVHQRSVVASVGRRSGHRAIGPALHIRSAPASLLDIGPVQVALHRSCRADVRIPGRRGRARLEARPGSAA